MIEENFWKICSSCKKQIPYGATYWVCSVSTCTAKRTNWVFCKVECWDAHITKMRHRDSWAVEKEAPSTEQWRKMLIEAEAPKTRTVSAKPAELPKPTAARTVIRRPKAE